MKSYIKRITSVVLSLAIAVGATSFTKFSNVNAQETPVTPQEPSVTNTDNADLVINDLAGLKTFRDTVNSSTTYEGKTVTLNADIDMSSIDNWDAIGTYTNSTDNKPFKGVFEGGNHKLSGLKINNNKNYQGLFGYTSGATIQNLVLDNVNVKGVENVGGLVGYDGGTIKNSYVTGEIIGKTRVGCLVGYDGGTIESSYVTGKVTGTNYVGDLVGYNTGTIKNSYATGSVTGTNSDVGGLVGCSVLGTITTSYAIGKVTGGNNVGGLVGYNGGTITTSYYDKDMTGQSDTGKGTPLSILQMIGDAAETNMIGFDFSSVWGTKAAEGMKSYYPYLKCFREDSAPYILPITEINNLADLQEFRDNVNVGITYEGATVTLKADIDIGAIDNWNAIGTYTNSTDNKPFKGTFEGNSKKISNLKINKDGEDNQGLFGYIAGSTIQNLGLENVNVKGKKNVGGLVGQNEGTIKTSYATGTITGKDYVGGLVGFNSGTIENSYAAGKVTGSSDVGGLVGHSQGEIENSYATGTITGKDYVGGLVGQNSGTIENNYATGTITGENYVGGLVGKNNGGTITTSYAVGKVTGKEDAGGLVGQNSGTVTNSYYDKNRTCQSDTGKGTPLSTTQMTGDNAKTNMTGFDFNNVWGTKADEGIKWYYPYLKNFGSETCPYIEVITEINNLADLQEFRDNIDLGTTYEGETVTLKADIDMSSIDSWDVIGTLSNPFKGTFEGGNHKLNGLKINNNKSYQGLFGYIEGATIENLGVEDANVKANSFVGGLVGQNNIGTIKNSYATGTITGIRYYVGGLVGFNSGTIENSYAAGKVTGSSDVGGLVGHSQGEIENSYATGTITGENYVGGLVGQNSGTIENNYATGTITGENYVGGLVGKNEYGIIVSDYATGTITGESNVGGLVGENNGGTITTSYAVGKVTGKEDAGGLVGQNSGTVTNSYYDKNRTCQSDTGKGTPLSTTQMTGDNAKTNMTGFDFNSVWGTKSNEGINSYYPYLKSFGVDSATCIGPIKEINTLENLSEFRDNVNSGVTYEGETVVLKVDIDMSSIDNWNAIGTYSNEFKGIFEGGSHKISNLKIDKESENYQGLFGYIGQGATIQNLGVENVNVKGNRYVGGLVGYNGGTIKNSYATGEIKGNYVGGLVGYNGGIIENSYATVEVIGTGDYVGGLVGYNFRGTITTSYGVGKVTGTENLGGLVGYNFNGAITNSYYDKDTTGQSDTGKGTPLSTTQMTGNAAQTSMTGFDFSSVWGTRDNEEVKGYYPYLKQFGELIHQVHIISKVDITSNIEGTSTTSKLEKISTTDINKGGSSVKTGDKSDIGGLLSILTLTTVGIVLAFKKKSK